MVLENCRKSTQFFTILTNKTLPNLPRQGALPPWTPLTGRVLNTPPPSVKVELLTRGKVVVPLVNAKVKSTRLSVVQSTHKTSFWGKLNLANNGKCIQYIRIDFYRKKPSKPLQNTLFYALVSICGGKPLITTNKLAGPVGKKGVLGGVYRLRNAWKTTKKK